MNDNLPKELALVRMKKTIEILKYGLEVFNGKEDLMFFTYYEIFAHSFQSLITMFEIKFKTEGLSGEESVHLALDAIQKHIDDVRGILKENEENKPEHEKSTNEALRDKLLKEFNVTI